MGFTYSGKNMILNAMTGRIQSASLAPTCMIGVGTMEGDVFNEPDSTTGYARTLLGSYQSADSKCMGEPVQGNIKNSKIIYLPEAINIPFSIGPPPLVFSTSSLACSNSSSLIISSLASSMPRCVYVFIVTLMSEWPIRYCSVLGFIPALCNHFNKRLEPCSFCNKAGHCL